MKAKELAALLLQNPELEVYREDYHIPDFSDEYYSTEIVSGIQVTPDGIFINTECIDQRNGVHPKSPSECPRINTIRMKMDDGEWFRFYRDEDDLDALYTFGEDGYLCNYIDWHGGYWILSDIDIDDDYVQDNIGRQGNTHYSPERVEYVEVLVSLDKKTWEPTYVKFTLDEAIKYAQEKKNG